jgi:hypothetical protein
MKVMMTIKIKKNKTIPLPLKELIQKTFRIIEWIQIIQINQRMNILLTLKILTLNLLNLVNHNKVFKILKFLKEKIKSRKMINWIKKEKESFQKCILKKRNKFKITLTKYWKHKNEILHKVYLTKKF